MLSITKLQNLKAIHNISASDSATDTVVINHKTTKFESNSQQFFPCYLLAIVVINHKTTKFESNSQLVGVALPNQQRCYQSQNYKIWKQFTTKCIIVQRTIELLSIAKLQNLKAIHNVSFPHPSSLCVVINRKTTKFESNSQHKGAENQNIKGCYQSQNYKIWKQFTTRSIEPIHIV